MSLQALVPTWLGLDGNMDSFQALGLCEEAMHFDVEVTFQGNQPKIFDISTRDTVDKVKAIAHAHFCGTGGASSEEYLLGINDKEKLEIEFVKFILAHVRIREDLESGELVRVCLFRKGYCSDTSAKEKIDLNTEINFAERRSSISAGLSKLTGSGKQRTSGSSPSLSTSSPVISKTSPRVSKTKGKEEPEVLIVYNSPPTRPPLSSSLPLRPNSPPSAVENRKELHKMHKRYHSESILEESPTPPPPPAPTSPTSPTKSPVPIAKGSSISSGALHKLVRNRRGLSVSTDLAHMAIDFAIPLASPPARIYTLPTLPAGISALPPLFDINTKGFVIEAGAQRTTISSNEIVVSDTLKSEPWYAQYFFGREHANYSGTDEALGVFLVSVMQEAPNMPSVVADDSDVGRGDGTRVRAVVRTKKGDEKKLTTVKTSGLFKSKKVSSKGILQSICPYLSTSKITRIKNPELCTALKTFEERQLVKCYKFGVLYCKAGQTEEEQMFSNKSGSADWQEFLEALGETITLQGWTNYRAGLDVKAGSTGEKSVYAKFQGFEVMYHVSTMLPHSDVNTQQLERKRHIGNDIVVIVFKEGNQPYDPNCIKSEFNHIFALVSKVTKPNDPKTYYHLQLACKEGVPHFNPELPASALFEKGDFFREFLLCKLINGENTSYEAPSFKIKIQRTRLALLKEIESKFVA